MSKQPAERRGLLQEGSDLSDTPPLGSSTSPRARQTFHRMDSSPAEATDPSPRYSSPVPRSIASESINTQVQGLGITDRRQSLQRVPVGSRASLSPLSPQTPFTPSTTAKNSPRIQFANSPQTASVPGSANPLLSPAWPIREAPEGSGHSRDQSLDEQDITKGRNIFTAQRDMGYGDAEHGSRTNLRDNDNDGQEPLIGCPPRHDIHSERGSWLSMSILFMSIYSTIFSGIWLVLAMVQPRYGRAIYSGGKLTPESASIVFALLAKTIELSFVTVFVTFLGQVLSRRSMVRSSRGVTIAEFTMRTWVIQPGFMITHWQYLKHVGITILGAITLTAAFVAMFYTTASDALVSPHLKYGKWESFPMQGLVKTSYANPTYIAQTCQTPILDDSQYAGTTCLSVEHAGQANHNLIAFLETWTQISLGGAGVSPDMTGRPRAPAMLFDNTTVTGSWVNTNDSNLTASYAQHNSRVIDNVTLSMPHAGVFTAARSQKNGILQPEELAGVGEYAIEASVVSPSLNVLCVDLTKAELAPLIYNNSGPDPQLIPGKDYLNSTVVDDIFLWGQTHKRQPPMFPKYPIDFNSVTNITVANSDSIYMLIKAPTSKNANYTICQMRSFLSFDCSTYYNVSGMSGGRLESRCGTNATKHMAYKDSVHVDRSPPTTAPDWRNVGSQWMLALSLNTGISDANSSTSRLLSQFIPSFESWSPARARSRLLPSMAEALAVMGGSTLLRSSIDASYFHYWGYESHILSPGVDEKFNATITSQQYTSGVTQKWQGVFYIVLVLIFATNVFCLTYFILRNGLVTDFTELQNLFSLAVNSPPSQRLNGSCGAGPAGEQLNVDFHVLEEESGHLFVKEGEGRRSGGVEMKRRRGEIRHPHLKSRSSYGKLSSARSSWL